MNPNELPPDFDAKLSDYLGKHHPSPPPPPPYEYARILRAIEAQGRRRRIRRFSSLLWMVPTAAAALLIGFLALRDWRATRPPHAIMARLTSDESTWVYEETSGDLRSPSEDWLMLADEVNAQR